MPVLESDVAAFKIDKEVARFRSVLAIGEAIAAIA
jgi:hypothetical protein